MYFQAKKPKVADEEDVPKRRIHSTHLKEVDVDDKHAEEDVDDEQAEDKPDMKPENKFFPPRYTEKGLWRVHNAVYRVSFVML